MHNNVKAKLESDRDKVDALIVIGTSLSVYVYTNSRTCYIDRSDSLIILCLQFASAPISKVIGYLPANIPRILINRTIVHPPEQTGDDADNESDDDEKEFRDNYVFDAYLLGFCDDVTRAIGKKLFSSDGDDEAKSETVDRGELLATVLENNNGADDSEDESSYNASDWTNVKVPHQRVFLFPGALAPAEAAEEVTYREVAHCDGCSKRIEGTIQKCVTCFDYDLCQKCFPTLSKSHFDGLHSFAEETAVPIDN